MARFHPDPLLEQAPIPDCMEVVTRAAVRADTIAAPVVLEPGVQGLVDVADPMAEELERRELLCVGRIGRCQHGDIFLDRRHHALLCQRAGVVRAKAGRVAWEIDEVLGSPLPWPVGPVARGAESLELRISPDQRNHPLARGIIQLEECQLTDGLVTEAAPGECSWCIEQQRQRCDDRCNQCH
jgi:hypothetical protein